MTERDRVKNIPSPDITVNQPINALTIDIKKLRGCRVGEFSFTVIKRRMFGEDIN